MSKRLLSFVMLAILLSVSVRAAVIRGVVVTDGEKPVSFAYISVEGRSQITQTDKDGCFSLALADGRYRLTAMLLGYQKTTIEVTAAGETKVRIYLKEDLISLSTVTVTGTLTPKTLANTPVVTRVITANDIQKLDATNIRDVLEAELPGLEYTKAMDGQDVLTMQGLGGQSLLFLIDGERLAGETLDNIDFRRLNTDNIERIEIVKGAASALYGSNAVGAVVNIITKSAAEPFTLHLNSHVGSRHGKQRHGSELGLHRGRVTNLFNVQTDRLGSYFAFDKGGKDSTRVYGNCQWNFKDKLSFRISDRFALTGKAGYYFHERNSSVDSRDRARDFSGSARLAARFDDANVLDLSYNFDRYDKSDYYIGPRKDILDYKNVLHSLRALFTHTFQKSLALTLGGDLSDNYLKSYQFSEDGSHSQVTADLFAQADWTIDKRWTVVGGLRGDYFSGYGWQLTPKLATMLALGRLKLRGSYSRGFRAPSLKERYTDFNMANIFKIYGNKDLKAETSHSFSASGEYVHRHYCFTLTGYYNILNNEITTLWDQTRDNGRGAMVYRNIEGTDLAGIDLSVIARYACGVGAKVSYAYFHEFPRGGRLNTSDSRPHTFTAQIDYRRTFRNYAFDIVLNGRYLSVNHYHTLARDYATYVPASSPAYSLWKLILRQRFYNAVDITLGIDNLFNYRPARYQYNSPFTTGTTLTATVGVALERLAKLF